MKKNVLVTGASGNLGKAVVEKFLKDGYRTVGLIEGTHSEGGFALIAMPVGKVSAHVRPLRKPRLV